MAVWRSKPRPWDEEQQAVDEGLEALARGRFSGAVRHIDDAVERYRTARTLIQPQYVIDELLDLRNQLVRANPKGGA